MRLIIELDVDTLTHDSTDGSQILTGWRISEILSRVAQRIDGRVTDIPPDAADTGLCWNEVGHPKPVKVGEWRLEA